ncbi:hypothetical protein NAT51_06040 [Flavobacterium amniphilum]|uniref:hypothetical protein n=1 Tax=Flavobacterium amniphilum TaxID=1834035 RepID=UPI002029DD98|nr:hypothetical protein [Flavobacterium amniphilum]MCL9805069.1 hypothetical protein [Flavobacterium amniphilum]
MEKFFFLFVSLFVSVNVYSQTVTYEDFKLLIPFVQNENYKEVFEKSNEILSKTVDDSSDLRGIVSYMNLYASAGMVTVDQMSYEDFVKHSDRFVGKRLVMAAHPCVSSEDMASNSIKFVEDDGKQRAMVITNNKQKVNILFFEYFSFSEKQNPEDYIGKNVRSGGILEKIEVNPNKSKIWIARLHMKDSFVRTMTPR